MQYREILKKLKSLSDPKAVTGMARFGIDISKAYGISAPTLRKLAKTIGTNHALAQRLWASGIRETRILAALIDDPQLVTAAQMESWVKDFHSWDICDACCGNLFDKTPFAYRKAVEWSKRKEEFVKRAGFVLMASLAVHDKEVRDEVFIKFLPLIKKHAVDERNFVKKAVNWALRQIGKRSRSLNRAAIKTAKAIQKIDSRAARWIAADALRELTSAKIKNRLR
ncbi:MAG: DNA alkylation repair protein [candidate division KSB1 bacterium]|nr:DNA alkylation repair protein [candidate division KSB1 bacterium]